MSMEAAIALAALVLSVFTLIRQERLSRALHKSQSEHEALQENVASLVSLWSQIGDKRSLLRFHGIADSDLQAAGLDAEELAYLVSSFEAAGYYYEHIDKSTGPFPESSLRYHMCASEATRRAWPLLKRFFPGSPTFRSRIEQTISLHEQARP